MAGVKFDGVIESVRYAPDGNILIVRAYQRRGATFSDYVLLDRQALVDQLKKRKKYVIGRRKEQLASTFETSRSIRLIDDNGKEVITTSGKADHDRLEETPVF
jgi:hypothetical protein